MEGQNFNELLKLDNYFAILDAYISLLKSAQEFDLVQPEIVESNSI